MLHPIRWLIYGLSFGIVIDIIEICASEDWQRWLTPRMLLANVIFFATLGLMTGMVQGRLARSAPLQRSSDL